MKRYFYIFFRITAFAIFGLMLLVAIDFGVGTFGKYFQTAEVLAKQEADVAGMVSKLVVQIDKLSTTQEEYGAIIDGLRDEIRSEKQKYGISSFEKANERIKYNLLLIREIDAYRSKLVAFHEATWSGYEQAIFMQRRLSAKKPMMKVMGHTQTLATEVGDFLKKYGPYTEKFAIDPKELKFESPEEIWKRYVANSDPSSVGRKLERVELPKGAKPEISSVGKVESQKMPEPQSQGVSESSKSVESEPTKMEISLSEGTSPECLEKVRQRYEADLAKSKVPQNEGRDQYRGKLQALYEKCLGESGDWPRFKRFNFFKENEMKKALYAGGGLLVAFLVLAFFYRGILMVPFIVPYASDWLESMGIEGKYFALALAVPIAVLVGVFVGKAFSFNQAKRRQGIVALVVFAAVGLTALGIANEQRFFDNNGSPLHAFSRDVSGNIEMHPADRKFDQRTGKRVDPISSKVIEELEIVKKGLPTALPLSISKNSRFFHSDGTPLLHYWEGKDGRLEFFAQSGVHPQTGEPLKPMDQSGAEKFHRLIASGQTALIVGYEEEKSASHESSVHHQSLSSPLDKVRAVEPNSGGLAGLRDALRSVSQ